MVFDTRVWSAGRILVIGGALLATYAASAAISARIALRLREVIVPPLVGQPLSSASAAVGDVGLALKVDETRRADPRIAAGRIARQDPAAGSVARRGRSIRVWLSAGARVAAVPKLLGETERTARLRIQQDGLVLAAVSTIQSSRLPADLVVAQAPPPGGPGPAVSLLVNRSERAVAYIMPDLIGLNGARAADLLRAGGFRVAVVAQNPHPGVPAGVVIRQTPQAGFQVTAGDTVSLEVSR